MFRFLIFIVLLIAGAGAAAGYAWYDYKQTLERPIKIDSADASANLFTVERGWSAKRTADELAKRSIIDKPHWFYAHARLQPRLTGENRSIKSGEFVLPAGITTAQLYDLLVEGQSKQYSHSIIEGTTFKQILASLDGIEGLVVQPEAVNAEAVMAAIGKADQHPEGLFFSDTYNFPRNTTHIAFLKRANESLQQVLDEEWQQRAPDLPYKTPYEALIMASIIEKETAVSAERPLIAGVFVSRLRKRMRLQTDPTVIYGIGDSYDGNIRRKDLRTDTPYNTYTRGGLPPTPISMVGREAINAALNPAATTALYFVAKGDGTHHFSETNDEHNRAVRKYQLKR